jgi:hypothetical protein
MSDKEKERKPPWKSGRYRIEGNILLAEGITLNRSKRGTRLHIPKPKPPRN